MSNPEFLREGSAISDFLRPDRIVIGASDKRAVDVMKEIYSPLYLVETPFVITDVASAELIKYASNGFLAVKISFINEIARLCELMGADVHDVARGMGLDRRIGSKFLHPGPGFGGSCFPKDTAAAADLARQHGYSFRDHRGDDPTSTRATKARMIEKIAAGRPATSTGRRRPSWACPSSRRPTTSASPPRSPWSRTCSQAGASVRAFDPAAMENARAVLPDVPLRPGRLRLRGRGGLPRPRDGVERVPRAGPRRGSASLLRSKTMVDLRNVVRAEAK